VPLLHPTLAHGNVTVVTDVTSENENLLYLKTGELRGAKNRARPENRKSVAFCPILPWLGLGGKGAVASRCTFDFEPDCGTGFAKTIVEADECPTMRMPLAPNEGGGELKRVGGADTISGQ
jgi:hypothetical protein